MKKSVLCLLLIAFTSNCFAQESQVTDVWVVFKTHFDLGYTDLPENVFARYRGAKNEQTVANLTTKSWEARLPLLAGYAEGEAGKLKDKNQGLTLSREGILVTAFGANPDGDETILRLWEQAGISGPCTVKLPGGIKILNAQSVNLRCEKQGDPFEVKDGEFSFDLKKYAPASFDIGFQKKYL